MYNARKIFISFLILIHVDAGEKQIPKIEERHLRNLRRRPTVVTSILAVR